MQQEIHRIATTQPVTSRAKKMSQLEKLNLPIKPYDNKDVELLASHTGFFTQRKNSRAGGNRVIHSKFMLDVSPHESRPIVSSQRTSEFNVTSPQNKNES